MNKFLTKKGMSTFVTLLILLATGTAVYSGFTIGRYYFDYSAASEKARDLLRDANYKNDEIIENQFRAYVKKEGIPIKEKNIQILRTENEIILRSKWKVVFALAGFEIKEFKFILVETRKL